jgi:hypothetical protein
MDWIIANNLLFWLVNSLAFRRWGHIPEFRWFITDQEIIANLLKKEYQRAIPHVKQMLQ